MKRNDRQDEAAQIRRAAYRWNTASGMIMAFQSVIMLIVLTRVCDLQTAGVFSIAYSNSSLFVYIGKYGMRRFQVSDINEQFSFNDYRASRVITDIAMAVSAAAFVLWSAAANGYSDEKTAIMFVMVLFKLVDCSEDVFMAHYQQHDRLDVGARILTIRVATAITLFAILVIAFGSLLVPLVISTAYTALFYVFEVRYVKHRYGMPFPSEKFSVRKVGKLLVTCFPLFAASFLLFYIGNTPKYAIDAVLDDSSQAYYGYVAMPSFVVTLLAGFIYNPIITSLTDQWLADEVRAFLARFAKLAGAIIALTIACDLAALLAGVPVLDILYNADTAPYLGELIILVTGGGFLALATLAVLGITIIRFQRVLVPVYAIAAIAATIAANWATSSWGITGAAWSYFASMGVLAVILSSLFVIGTRVLRRR